MIPSPLLYSTGALFLHMIRNMRIFELRLKRYIIGTMFSSTMEVLRDKYHFTGFKKIQNN